MFIIHIFSKIPFKHNTYHLQIVFVYLKYNINNFQQNKIINIIKRLKH
nr:MAG TPA: hypothetical protein [Caudoviricetes sp.]